MDTEARIPAVNRGATGPRHMTSRQVTFRHDILETFHGLVLTSCNVRAFLHYKPRSYWLSNYCPEA